MSMRCYYRNPQNGEYCKNWAVHGSRFCNNHRRAPSQPAPALPNYAGQSDEQILASLAAENISPPETYDEMFDLVSRAMAYNLEGRISPGQAYAAGYLADVWVRAQQSRLAANAAAQLQRSAERSSAAVRQKIQKVPAERLHPDNSASAPVPSAEEELCSP